MGGLHFHDFQRYSITKVLFSRMRSLSKVYFSYIIGKLIYRFKRDESEFCRVSRELGISRLIDRKFGSLIKQWRMLIKRNETT